MAIYGKYMQVTKLSELPIEIQTALCEERTKLCEKWKQSDAYNICFTNAEGTRYFRAHRKTYAHHIYDMPFGGGSVWEITYGKILWDTKKAPLGDLVEYMWIRSGKVFGKAANGTEIPRSVSTKKEVMEIAKSIGILVM